MCINETLNWKAHMLEIHSKINRNLGVVRKIARFLDRNSLLQLYHSLIMSHIRNGIIVWHNSHIGLRKKIQACANKFLRMIFYLKPRDSVRNLMKENKLLSVNQIYHFETAKLMHRFTISSIPKPLHDIFVSQTRPSNTGTRGASSILPPPSRTVKCTQTIRSSAPKIWNDLPKEVKFVETVSFSNIITYSIKCFITKMKAHALNNIDFI